MRILHVSHRDLRHPKAGGLEVAIHEMSYRWLKKGYEVNILCAGYFGGPSKEMVDGIQIYRIGREEIFNFIAGFWLQKHQWLNADIIIEHLSKVACFLPLFSPNRPLVGHVPHLFGKSIFEEVSPLLGFYVYGMEKLLSLGYRQTPIWAMSESTQNDLIKIGLSQSLIKVIMHGADASFFEGPCHPSKHPSILYVGRIRKYKGLVDPLLKAWKKVIAKKPSARLKIVGKGEYEPVLRSEIETQGLKESVEMLGFIGSSLKDHSLKRELMKSAWLLVYPSAKEGWGLSVIEAAAAGIPSVASNVPGLCESVRDGETGLLVPYGNVDALADAILRLIEDDSLRCQMGEAAQKWSRKFDWDFTANRVLEWMQEKFPELKNSL